MIAAKVANALALDYPRERLEVIVACDGCGDETAERARGAGADLVLELPRGGKIRAQDAAVAQARGEILAFSDANSSWDADAARELVGAFADREVGYACGQVHVHRPRRGHQPGGACTGATSWRCASWSRGCPRSRPATARSTRPAATATSSWTRSWATTCRSPSTPSRRACAPSTSPAPVAREKMVPSLEGEFERKRRMMSHTWPILLQGGMLSLRGYPPRYALMIISHRLLRYSTPGLHLLALACNVALVALGAGVVYTVTLVLQLALLAAAALAGALPLRGRC